MDNKGRKTVLTGGENYVVLPDKKTGGPVEDRRDTYEVMRDKIVSDIESINNTIEKMPKKYFMDEIVVNLKMRIDRSAKSYHPSTLLRECNFREVGTRRWETTVIRKHRGKEKEEIKIGKDIFIAIKKKDLSNLRDKLLNNELSASNKDSIRSIEELYIDNHELILKSFSKNWKMGRVEITLHPIKGYEQKSIDKLKTMLIEMNSDVDSMKVKVYKNGPIFISCIVNKETLEVIKKINVVRSIQPLILRSFDDLINDESEEVPKGREFRVDDGEIPPVKLGVFDGGVTINNPIFKKFVTEHNLTKAEFQTESLNHGNAVISAALFGDLKQYKEEEKLPVPLTCVESFRVLPLEDKTDYVDMYEVIDHIENVVPKFPNIKVFNLSIGPSGPIEDDVISRFTYALDNLTKNGDRIFCVAVGNNGEEGEGIGRIEPPSDSVNNISVGSYMIKDDKKIHAPYSCYGDGREGAKIKPDVSEYGGCDENNMMFLSSNPKLTLYGSGTSFASPVVARKIASILGYSSIKSPLTTKALLINKANGNNKPDKYLGNGTVPSDIEEILECTKNKITITFEKELLKSKSVKINLPFVDDMDFDGKVSFKWTVCVATSVNSKETDDYTDLCVEDTFVPNIQKYRYYHPNKVGRNKCFDREKNNEEIKELLDMGWTESKTPITHNNTGNYNYKTEQERRSDFKWDTVINRFSGKIKYEDVKRPYIVLHAMSRDREGIENDMIKYSVVVTIEYINNKEDVYDRTLNKYNLLSKAEVELKSRLNISK